MRFIGRGLCAVLLCVSSACGASGDDVNGTGIDDTGGDATIDPDVAIEDGGLNPDGKLETSLSDSPDDACIGVTSEATLIPLDIYVMFDQSGSMEDLTSTGATKWDAVKSAFTSFLGDTASTGIGVGIQYFAYVNPGVPTTCTVDTDCKGFGPCASPMGCDKDSVTAGVVIPCSTTADCKTGKCVAVGVCALKPTNACFTGANCGPYGPCNTLAKTCQKRESCNIADYAKAEVEIATLPGVKDAIVKSLAAHGPTTATPTAPALAGAVQHATAWAKSNPTHAVVVLLVTDGEPTTCTPLDIPSIAKLASDGLAGSPSIRTYVIGVLGKTDTFGPNLDTISKAGNGKGAFLVSTASDVTKDFLAALTAIRGTALACEYALPAAASADYFKVNVKVTLGGSTTLIPYVAKATACDPTAGGWYYDVDPSAGTPTKIIMCPATCTTFKATTGGKIDIEVGCKTVSIVK